MLNFCTLFDSNYIAHGLLLHQSLLEVKCKFNLYIFAFDDLCYEVLKKLNLENVTVISLTELEEKDKELFKIKKDRTAGEYCWTATPAIILYCLNHLNLKDCIYLDADLYFYSNPEKLIEEMGDNSVLITPHFYSPQYDHSKKSGIFCVQFLYIKNDTAGLDVLNWWHNSCIDWCYAKYEDGKFGDQKYLDCWPEKFKSVYVSNNLGGGVAPWNIQQYNLISKSPLTLENKKDGLNFDVIFYHFHAFKLYDKERVCLCSSYYEIPKWVIDAFYKDYLVKLLVIIDRLNEHKVKKYESKYEFSIINFAKKIKSLILGSYNVYAIKEILNG